MSAEHSSQWLHEKTEATATGGMVTSRHPLSAEAGAEILKLGGNAVDAVVAASFAESVVQPSASTIGGGGVFLLHAEDGSAYGIDYMWQTPMAATADMFPLDGPAELRLFGWSGVKDQLNEIGGLAAAVPGSVAGLVKAHELYGELPLSEVLMPAIRLADQGFEMDWYGSLMAAIHLDILKRFPTTAGMLLREGQYPYRPNMIGAADVHRQPQLAKTLEAIAAEGAPAFYSGPIAQSIVDAVRNNGGIFSMEDMENYEAVSTQPVEFVYRGRTVRGEQSGVTIFAQILNVLSHFDVGRMAPDSVERLHLFIEVIRHCRQHRLTKPGNRQDLAVLEAPEYAAWLASQINLSKRTDIAYRSDDGAGSSIEQSRTVHIAAADSRGCVASITETVIGNYGCFVTSDTGVLLNNGMISFAPIAGQPNSISPGKRNSGSMSPLHVIYPNDGSAITIGSSGGSKILTSVVEILSLIVDHGLSPQAAVAFPRVDFEGDLVVLDARFGESTAASLRAMGHDVELRSEELSTFEFGNPSVIARARDGRLTAGVNPYQATCAVGFDRD